MTEYDIVDDAVKMERDPKQDAKYTNSSFMDNLPVMNAETLRLVAIENDGYDTPELNDKLYLHFKGYRRIENLEPYYNLASLFLDSNGFDTIEGLGNLKKLRSLFLQKNLIRSITGLGGLTHLVSLDLSENRIDHIGGLSSLNSLQTLNVAKNCLTDEASVVGLTECQSITNVDLSNNDLADESIIKNVLGEIGSLVACNLSGNSLNNKVGQFRKKCICAIKKLRYMDRPVDEDERAAAEAWEEGGAELERKVKKERQEKAKNKDKQSLQDFRDWQKEIRRKRQVEIEEEKKSGVVSEERKKEKEKRERETEEREKQAKVEADEERKVYSDENVALKMGSKHWNKGVEKRDNFGIVVNGKGEEEDGDFEYGSGATGADLKNDNDVDSEEEDAEGMAMMADLYSYQGGAPKRPGEGGNEKEGEAVKAKAKANDGEEEEEEENDEPEEPFDEEAAEREMRVQESLEIYRAQQAAKKAGTTKKTIEKEENEIDEDAKNHDLPTPPPTNLPPAPPARESDEENNNNNNNDKFYWSETMDARLAAFVHSEMFDFTAVATSLQGCLSESDLGGLDKSIFTEESCRLRWCELDVEESNMEVGDVAIRQMTGECRIPVELGGKQLSFEQLQRQVNSSGSSLLVPPKRLPGGEDEDSEGEGEGEEVVIVTREQLVEGFKNGGLTDFETLD